MIEAVSVLMLIAGCFGASVHDGDTFRTADCVSHRIWGIDAVELDQTCGDRPCGLQARGALAELVDGHTVVCDVRGRSYKRVVSQCFVGKVDIGRQMVRLGWAFDVPQFSGGEYAEEEREARRAKRGAWAYSSVTPPFIWRNEHGRRHKN